MSGPSFRVKLDKDKVLRMSKASAKKALHDALDHLASVSKEQVPLDHGPLKDSCYVDVAPDGKSGTVSYDTPYAVVQHENMEYQHQRGRKAKYLEDPVNDGAVQGEMQTLLKNAYEGEFK